jgi:hypothetical protein
MIACGPRREPRKKLTWLCDLTQYGKNPTKPTLIGSGQAQDGHGVLELFDSIYQVFSVLFPTDASGYFSVTSARIANFTPKRRNCRARQRT